MYKYVGLSVTVSHQKHCFYEIWNVNRLRCCKGHWVVLKMKPVCKYISIGKCEMKVR